MLDEAQLRDWFAAKALPRFIAHDRNRRPVSNPEEAATQAYAYADAMMTARLAAPPAPSVADAADAARYRHLRRTATCRYGRQPTDEEYDAMIDAAIAKEST